MAAKKASRKPKPKPKPKPKIKAKTKIRAAPKKAKSAPKAKTTVKIIEKKSVSFTKFSPTGGGVLVKREEDLKRTPGGLFIPDSAQEKPLSGIVISVGRGAKDKKGRIRPPDVKSGDKVLFAKWVGIEIKINDDDFLLLKETDVLGVVN